MSRQNNYNKKQFFQKSIIKSQALQKKKADIRSIKYGNISVPDPKIVTGESEDSIEKDLEVIDDE